MPVLRSPLHSPIRSAHYSPLVGKWGLGPSAAFDTYQPVSALPSACQLWKRRITSFNEFSVYTAMDTAGAYINWYFTDRLDAALSPRLVAATEIAALGGNSYDVKDHPTFPSSSANVGTWVLSGVGNAEYASMIRKPADADGAKALVGGTHGNESAPSSLIVTVDGVVVDYAGAAIDTRWNATSSIVIDTTHDLNFPSGGKWATMRVVRTLSRAGYFAQITRTTTADAVVYDDYGPMLNLPSPLLAQVANTGGYTKLRAKGDIARTFNAHDNSTTSIPTTAAEVVAYNDKYAALMVVSDQAALFNRFSSHSANAGVAYAIAQDRSDNYLKFYLRQTQSNDPNTYALPSGDAFSMTVQYRIAKGATGWTSVFEA